MLTFLRPQRFALFAYTIKAGSSSEQNSDEEEELGEESDENCDEQVDSHMEQDSSDIPDGNTTTRLTLSVGQWVLVRYDGLEFPGEVTSCGEKDAEVNVMHRSGSVHCKQLTYISIG